MQYGRIGTKFGSTAAYVQTENMPLILTKFSVQRVAENIIDKHRYIYGNHIVMYTWVAALES
jgi:hypothetical protein